MLKYIDEINYQIEESITPKEFIEILKSSALSERRPVNDFTRIKEMCKNADIIITARLNGRLIGLARSISDFVYCTYLSDLAVDREFQKMGIGKRLIEETKRNSPQATLILLSAPAAIDYYPKIGMEKHDQCFVLKDLTELH